MLVMNMLLAILLVGWNEVEEQTAVEHQSNEMCPFFRRLVKYIAAKDMCELCCGKDKAAENKDPLDYNLADSTDWKVMYPAGCPQHRIRDFLRLQMKLEPDDLDDIVELLDNKLFSG